MSRTPSQREALRHYQQARDIEHNLLDEAGINPWRVLGGVVIGMLGIVLAASLWTGLVALFGMRWGP